MKRQSLILAVAAAWSILPVNVRAQDTSVDPFISEVRALPAEQQVGRVIEELKKLNPGYDGREVHRIDQGEVRELSFHTESVKDISPVRALTGLTVLNAEAQANGGQLADLGSLRNLKLRELRISGNQVRDLSPLKDMPLDNLNLMRLQNLVSLEPLRGLPLKNLLLGYSTGVHDIEPLSGMPLQGLGISYLAISDWSPLAGLPLKDLYFGKSKTPPPEELLRGIPTLEKINLLPPAEYFQTLKAGPDAAKPAAATGNHAPASHAEKLKTLKRAFEQGLMSKDAYDQKVKEILDGI
jgi:Leucine-rich repeat (LRR) protein